jgi:subtilisin family serine protease
MKQFFFGSLGARLALVAALSLFSGVAGAEEVPCRPFEPVDWGTPVTQAEAANLGFATGLRDGLPNDPFFPKQYGWYNEGQPDDKGRHGFPGCDIKLFDALKAYKPQKEIILAIVDSGLDLTHEDIDPAVLWTNPGETGPDANGNDKATNGIDDDQNGYIDDVHGWNFQRNTPNIQEDQYHGTHVGGQLCARVNNGVGIAGAYPGLKIMLVKVFGLGGYLSSEQFATAIRYAVDNGAMVLSNSYGTPSYTQAMNDAVAYTKSKGALFVCAAGNSRKNMDLEEDRDYPSCYGHDNQLVVGATNNQDFATFCNYGSMVDIAAPGENMFSLMPKNQYRSLSGTSQACPVVAGAACLVWAMNPQFSYREVKQRLIDSADQVLGLSLWVRDGLRLNLFNALTGKRGQRFPTENFDLWKTEPVSIQTPHPYPNNATLTFDISRPQAAKMRLHFSRFGVEHYGDKMLITTTDDRPLAFVNGQRGSFWTDVYATQTVRLVLFTNETSTDYGFHVDQIQWLPVQP